MISITIPQSQSYDSKQNLFYRVEKDTTIQLEHSLISLQKWESKWHKSFLDTDSKTYEETIDYIRCMCLTQNVKDDVFYCIPKKELDRVSEYIENPMTATVFRERKETDGQYGRPKKQPVTAEIIYYWMISDNIPSEYRKWHLNQLLTLIRVFSEKNRVSSGKKRSRREILRDYKSINEENKKRFNTKG